MYSFSICEVYMGFIVCIICVCTICEIVYLFRIAYEDTRHEFLVAVEDELDTFITNIDGGCFRDKVITE